MKKQAELRANYKQYGSKEYEGMGSTSKHREVGKERKRGYYVRKPRPGHDEYHSASTAYQNTGGDRKRRPKQYWVAKGDPDNQVGHDTFIRDTRQKTSTVFDRISEQKDTSADPAGQGRRDQ